MQRGLRIAPLLLVALIASACGLVSELTVPPHTVSVSADQIALAMQEDRFFSDYRNAKLLVSGTVADVTSEDGETIIELATSIPTKVRCDLGPSTVAVQVGAPITVTSSDGERIPDAILLRGCALG